MAGVRERADANRTREAGHLDEIQGAVANTLKLHRDWAVGFIDWLGRLQVLAHYVNRPLLPNARTKYCPTQA